MAEVGEDFLCPICEEWHSVEFPMLKSVIERNLLALPGHRHRAQSPPLEALMTRFYWCRRCKAGVDPIGTSLRCPYCKGQVTVEGRP